MIEMSHAARWRGNAAQWLNCMNNERCRWVIFRAMINGTENIR